MQRSRWLFGQLMSRGPRMPPLRCGPGHCGCSCPACCSTAPLAPTASQNQSGDRGFWTSKPPGGSCSFRVPPVASQPLRVTPSRRFRLPSKTAARSVQPGWSARESSPQPAQPSSPAPWPLCRSTPLPSCATQPGDPPSRTSPWTRRLWNSSLRPLSRSPPTRSLQTCAVPVKEQQRAPVATPRSCAALFWMTKHLVLLSSEQPLISHGRRFPLAAAIGLGRIVALQKPNGRVRGIVVGDFLRRLVARSLAHLFRPTCRRPASRFSSPSPHVPAPKLLHTPSRPPDATILSVPGNAPRSVPRARC